ncbi:hypothetical protein LguiB_021276 [Lonicera macranthoides]
MTVFAFDNPILLRAVGARKLRKGPLRFKKIKKGFRQIFTFGVGSKNFNGF